MSTLHDLLSRQPGSSSTATRPDALRFCAEGRLPLASLSVGVEGFGPLSQPLSPDAATALHRLSEPARFGRREQTLLDPAVRHTGEIDPDLIDLDWAPGVFAALQRDVAQALGVKQLDAWLHNLLIYAPGQFFKPHQDTEKHPGMVATLVLVWPSPHIGGELRVQLGDEGGRLASQHLQLPELRWFAFYADCRHEVLPVEEGWRVVLTFDLVVPKQVRAAAPASPLQEAVTAALRMQFSLDTDAPRERPWVLLLDHEYTEHGLRWPLLKGDDRWRAELLRAAAESLGLRVSLALAELHENWTAEPVYHSRRSRYGDDDQVDGNATPVELIDRELSLDFWVDAEDRVGPRHSLAIESDEAVSFIETGDQHLVAQEYEGYMGNYGETLDYWYRRAALVIRTPLADERDRFELDFDAALADLLTLAHQAGSDPEAAAALSARVQIAARSLAFRASDRGRVLLTTYADIASALPDPAAARTLLAAFDPTRLEQQDAEPLARLARQRGADWLHGLLQTWFAPDARHWSWRPGWHVPKELPRLWPAPLPQFVAAALLADWPAKALDELCDASLRLLISLDAACARGIPALRQHQRPALMARAVELAQALVLRGDDSERHLRVLIDHLLASPLTHPVETLRPLVEAVGPLGTHWPADKPLRPRVITALRQALAEPERSPADHGLRGITWICRCADCTTMITWAESPAATPLTLSMAEPRRRHVQEKFSDAGAPFSSTTLRQGSPHKLVLGKPADLLAQDRAVRVWLAGDLAALGG